MITGFADRENGGHLRGMTRTGFQGANPTLEVRDPAFKNIRGRVGNPRINVAALLQREQTRSAVRALQVIGCGLVDRDGATAVAFLRCIPGVKLAGVETKFTFSSGGCHKDLLLNNVIRFSEELFKKI